MKFNLFFLVANRVDLLKRAIDSIPQVWDKVIVLNNTGSSLSLDRPVEVRDPPVPLTFSQSQNWMQVISRDLGNDFLLSMHDDAYLSEDWALAEFLRFAKEQFDKDDRVGYVTANYDRLIAYRMAMVDEVGEWDVFLPQYGSDEDWFHRAKMGWREEICGDVAKVVIHEASMTIKSDPDFNFKTQMLQSHWVLPYLDAKWGRNREYKTPFNN